jgi:hypothetical protein
MEIFDIMHLRGGWNIAEISGIKKDDTGLSEDGLLYRVKWQRKDESLNTWALLWEIIRVTGGHEALRSFENIMEHAVPLYNSRIRTSAYYDQLYDREENFSE